MADLVEVDVRQQLLVLLLVVRVLQLQRELPVLDLRVAREQEAGLADLEGQDDAGVVHGRVQHAYDLQHLGCARQLGVVDQPARVDRKRGSAAAHEAREQRLALRPWPCRRCAGPRACSCQNSSGSLLRCRLIVSVCLTVGGPSTSILTPGQDFLELRLLAAEHVIVLGHVHEVFHGARIIDVGLAEKAQLRLESGAEIAGRLGLAQRRFSHAVHVCQRRNLACPFRPPNHPWDPWPQEPGRDPRSRAARPGRA